MVLGRPRCVVAFPRRGLTVLVAILVLASAFALPATGGRVAVHAPTATASVVLPPNKAETLGAPRSTDLSPETSDTALSAASAGSVVRTLFPGFNTSLPGSFTSSVSSWQVGSPTYVPSTDTLWFPQRSVPLPGYPVPSIAPVAVFNLASGEFDKLVTNLSNASALAYDPTSGNVYAALPGDNSVAVVNSRTGVVCRPRHPSWQGSGRIGAR